MTHFKAKVPIKTLALAISRILHQMDKPIKVAKMHLTVLLISEYIRHKIN